MYLDERGERVTDPETLARIRGLVIPPAWTDVWICPVPVGHLQAVGTDAAGRKQFLYHPRWRARRDQQKFDRMLEFAGTLPRVREVTREHLAEPGLTRNRVLACATRLLDRGFFRIGSEAYAGSNGTFGLATMRCRHVRLGPDGLVEFEYLSKGRKERVQSVVDAEVHDVVARLKRRRGDPELLAYRRGKRWADLRSDDINAYIKDIAGEEYSAKDFRTWHGTVMAATALAVAAPMARSRTAARRTMSWAVRDVARYLGNTPAVCRASYIDPRVFDRFRSGWTIAGVLNELGTDRYDEPELQGIIEEAVIDLIRGDDSSSAVHRVDRVA